MALLHSRRDRASVLILVLGAAILVALLPFLSGLLGAAVLYVLFVGSYRRLARMMPAGVAAALTLVAAVLVILIPLSWVVGVLIEQAPDSVRAVEASDLFARVSALHLGRVDVGAEIAKASGTIFSWLSGQLIAFVGGATSVALNLVVAFFALYYMLRSGPQMWSAMRGYIPFTASTADALRDRFFSVTEATLLGTGLTALLQGTIVGAGFAFVQLPHPLFWGTVTAFASILPVLGSALVWLPAVIVLVVQQRYAAAVLMLLMGGLVASNIDNLVRPLVYKRVSNIHPMITLIGAFAGVRYFGLLGVLLGPLAIAYLFELLAFYRVEYGPEEAAPIVAPATAPQDYTPAAR